MRHSHVRRSIILFVTREEGAFRNTAAAATNNNVLILQPLAVLPSLPTSVKNGDESQFFPQYLVPCGL